MKGTRTILGALLLSSSLAAQPAFAAGGGAPQGLSAEVIHVTTQVLDKRISVVGTLRANETILLRPEQGGRIEQILFEEGQAVAKDSPLFKLDTAIYRAELSEAEARVQLSEIAYNRAQSLLQKRVGSEQDRDSSLAQLRVNQAQQALAQARLDKMTIRSPFAGTTGLRLVSPGDYVNAGQDLVELTDIRSMKVDFRVPEIYLQSLQPGSSIEVQVDAFPGRTFQGQVYAVAPGSDSRAHNIRVRARIPNPDGALRPGLFAKVELITTQHNAAILIPEQAIIPKDGAFFVMRVEEGNRVALTPVQMGQRRPGQVQITAGLNSGDLIVTAGQLKLHPGMPITPIFVDGSNAVAQGD